MLSIASLLGGVLARFLTVEGLKFIALRAFLITLFLTVGPIVIFKGFGLIVKFMSAYGGSMVQSLFNDAGIEAQMVNLVGVGAWIGNCLKVPEGVSVFLSFLSLKFVFRFLPKMLIPMRLS